MKCGKKICELLTTIRKDVAQANGIDYIPNDCHHEGDCAGTCSKCDKELSDLQQQLDAKQQSGEDVIYDPSEVLGIDAATLSSNTPQELMLENEEIIEKIIEEEEELGGDIRLEDEPLEGLGTFRDENHDMICSDETPTEFDDAAEDIFKVCDE